MNQKALLQLASTQAQTFVDWARTEDPYSIEWDFQFQFWKRPSGVVDVIHVGDGEGCSDPLFHVGYVTRRGVWVKTYSGATVPCEYWEGVATEVHNLVVQAAA